MEYTKLTLELTSPEYTDHFHSLPADARSVLARAALLYKGISGDLVDDIFDTLYRLSLHRTAVPTTCSPTPSSPPRDVGRRARTP